MWLKIQMIYNEKSSPSIPFPTLEATNVFSILEILSTHTYTRFLYPF